MINLVDVLPPTESQLQGRNSINDNILVYLCDTDFNVITDRNIKNELKKYIFISAYIGRLKSRKKAVTNKVNNLIYFMNMIGRG